MLREGLCHADVTHVSCESRHSISYSARLSDQIHATHVLWYSDVTRRGGVVETIRVMRSISEEKDRCSIVCHGL
jgi:hypothetical protein